MNWEETSPAVQTVPGFQGTGEGDLPWLSCESDVLTGEDVLIGLVRPFHQPSPPPEHAAAGHGQRHRHEEADGGTGLAAVQRREDAGAGSAAADAGHDLAPLGLHRAQLGHAVQGGADVLGVSQVVDAAGAVGQGCADDEAVCLALGGGTWMVPLSFPGVMVTFIGTPFRSLQSTGTVVLFPWGWPAPAPAR